METRGRILLEVYFTIFSEMMGGSNSGLDKWLNHYASGLRDEPLKFLFCFVKLMENQHCDGGCSGNHEPLVFFLVRH